MHTIKRMRSAVAPDISSSHWLVINEVQSTEGKLFNCDFIAFAIDKYVLSHDTVHCS